VADLERSACPTCGSCSGMFTANSMNCLTEALGLSLPGNGSLLATHAERKELFLRAGRVIVDLARRYYEQDDQSVLPRAIASRAAFANAMSLDVAMGGSTNTVLHLLAAAREAEVDFTMADIDAISRKVPCLCKVAPASQQYHMEDVHRAGGVMAILGELDRAGLIERDLPIVHGASMGAALDEWDVARASARDDTRRRPWRFRKACVIRNSIWTARAAVSATRLTPIAWMVAWRCCLATLRSTGASSRPRVWTMAICNSRAARACLKVRTRRWRRFWPIRSWPAMWW